MPNRILVTGVTGGIGEHVVAKLAARGDTVVAHGRDRAAVERLVASLPSGTKALAVVADLASLTEVAKLAKEVGNVDVLINNAGVGFGSDRAKRETSKDGFELRMAVNYLAPFLLTERISRGDGGCRAVVNVASVGQAPLAKGDLMSTRDYDGVLAYRRSKLALVMDTFERARRDARCHYVCLHPGTFLATKMVKEAGITPLGKAEDGADAVIALLDRALAGETGSYFDVMRPERADPAAYDEGMQTWLREQGLALTKAFR